MRKLRTTLRSLLLTACAAIAFSNTANATIFTAVASGNFSSALTWGGLIPGSLLSSDVIIIPAGIDVTLDADAVFSGTSSLNVDGTLMSSGSTALVITSGALSGTGTIDVDSMSLGLTTGFSFTGSVWTDHFTSTGANVGTAANIWVRNSLNLASGSLVMTDGNITLYNNSTVTVSGGSISASGSAVLSLDSAYTVIYTATTASTSAELSGSGLTNVTLNLPGTVTLSQDLTVNGNLSLSSGTLELNGHALTIGTGGNLLVASGALAGSTTSDVNIMSTSGLSGALTFTSSGSSLHNLHLNMGSSATADLGSSLSISGMLNLESGRLRLGANDLTIATGGMLMGGSSSSYVVADGTGRLMMSLAAGGADTFAVGSSAHFSPIVVVANSGSASGTVGVNVMGNVLSGGTTGTVISSTDAMVSATWHVSSTATTAINYDLWAMWDASMEVNGFDRTHAYISHYTSGAWDASATSAASASGSLYVMHRSGITSLSPFMVTDNTFGSTGIAPVAANQINIYPNPANNVLHINAPLPVSSTYIYDLSGKLIQFTHTPGNVISIENLPQGLYTITLTGADFSVTRRFVKQ